jgi:hypothetical protein
MAFFQWPPILGNDTTATLTNKTISGSSNTITNIADGSLTTSYIKADGTRALTANWAAGNFSATHNSVGIGTAANTIAGLTVVNATGATACTWNGQLTVKATSGTGALLVDSTTTDAYVGLSSNGTGKWFFQNIGSGSHNMQLGNASVATVLDISQAGAFIISTGTTNQHRLNTLLATNGVQTATMTNLPAAATSGNPNGWVSININGTTSYMPFWH